MPKHTSRQPDARLVATLGSEPQVVTAVLDLLRQQGETLREVVVVHTTPGDQLLQQAIHTLQAEFSPAGAEAHTPLQLVAIHDERGAALEDVSTARASQAAFRCLFQQIKLARQAGRRVHLSIAGGRKTLAVYGMLAAQLLFDDDDHLWHLVSAGDFLQSKRLHPQPGDQARLVDIPVVRWSKISPMLLDVAQFDDPYEALQRQQDRHLEERLLDARSFVRGALTAAEERAVQWLVREGLSDAHIAERLGCSPRTVEQHLRSAFRKAAAHWELEDVNRTQLVGLLSFYYEMEGRGDGGF